MTGVHFENLSLTDLVPLHCQHYTDRHLTYICHQIWTKANNVVRIVYFKILIFINLIINTESIIIYILFIMTIIKLNQYIFHN